MRDRIVPIQKTDLINMYYTMFAIAGSAPNVITATNPAEFNIDEAGLCEEPVKTATIELASGDFYFVPSLVFEGFYIDGNLVETTGDTILADGVTLYKATVADGGISIAQVSL